MRQKKSQSKRQTEWNLGLLYRSHKDPRIERDVRKMERAFRSFSLRWRYRSKALRNENVLTIALKEWERLVRDTSSWKPVIYFHYRKDLDGEDAIARSNIVLLTNRLTRAANNVVFFPVALGRIPRSRQRMILADPALKRYRHYLSVAFREGRYNLSEPEEKLMNVKSLTSRQLWIEGQESLLARETVKWRGRALPLSEANNLIADLPTRPRRELHTRIVSSLRSISHFAENELNAVCLDKKINDELRGFRNPWSAAVLSYQNGEPSVMRLVDLVSSFFSISHRFYAAKARMLGERRLTYADRAASVGKIGAQFRFPEAVKILLRTFRSRDDEFVDILEHFLERGQVDVYPKRGKTGGAYCSGSMGNPTYVLLNYTKGADAVLTFAHEMGHAIHSEFSKSQPPLYQEYTLAAAEIASTLFEQIVFDELTRNLSPRERVIALHDKLNDDVSTVFRQIACFNFEAELHAKIRESGFVPSKEISALLNRHMKAYLGPLFDLTENDGFFFVQWSHLRRFFYVYTYAYGKLVSKAMYARWREDLSFAQQVKLFLRAGGSKSPDEILNDIGLNTRSTRLYEEGLREIEREVGELETLTRRGL